MVDQFPVGIENFKTESSNLVAVSHDTPHYINTVRRVSYVIRNGFFMICEARHLQKCHNSTVVETTYVVE